MERVHQMNVVPDLYPSLHPTIDLRLNFPEAPPEDIVRRTRMKRKLEKVEPGVFLLPEQVRNSSSLHSGLIYSVLDSETTTPLCNCVPSRTAAIHTRNG